MIYLYLGIAAVILSVVCKGVPIMRDMIRHDHGEYDVHFRKRKEQPEQQETSDTQESSLSAAEILKARYAREEAGRKH